METGITTLFFFGKKVIEEERKFSNAVGNLYYGIKEDEAAKQVSDDELQIFSKEIASQILVEITGCQFFDLLDKNMVLLKRQLMAYHCKKAYQLKVGQRRDDIQKQTR